MLTVFGVAIIAVLLLLILFRITSALVALILVPLVGGLAAGLGADVGLHALAGIQSVAATAAMLGFAVLFFGVMNDAGLFDPVIRGVVRFAGADPRRVVIGTAAIAMVAHLDGAGASTFLVTVPALLPVYDRLQLDRAVLACTVALAAGTMNIMPWGGPGLRAAAALQVDVADLIGPLFPAVAVGLTGVFGAAAWLGQRERRRLTRVATAQPAIAAVRTGSDVARPVKGWRFWVNVLLTVAALSALLSELLPLPLVFMVALAIALVVNHPDPQAQRDRLSAHGSHAMLMVAIILAAGVFAGILRQSGMLAAMGADLVGALPAALTPHLPVLMATTAMPLSLVFDPDSFYFGVLPVVASASEAAGVPGVEVARAALLGQMTTGFPVSPLTPATFLLTGLAGIDLAEHQRRTIPLAFGITLLMTVAAVVTCAFRL